MNERIKKVRKELNLTQAQFAQRIGSTQNTLANYEIGRRNPSGSVINNICKEFNVNENWLRSGEGEMFSQMSRDEETMKFVAQILSDDDRPLKSTFLNVVAKIINDDRCYELIESELLKIINEVKKKTE